MNEHINQCWEEAAKAFTGDTWAEQTDFLERFAQLVVLECARVADGSLEIITMKPEWPSKYIKEHFGVE